MAMRVALTSGGNRDGCNTSTRVKKETNTAEPDILPFDIPSGHTYKAALCSAKTRALTWFAQPPSGKHRTIVRGNATGRKKSTCCQEQQFYVCRRGRCLLTSKGMCVPHSAKKRFTSRQTALPLKVACVLRTAPPVNAIGRSTSPPDADVAGVGGWLYPHRYVPLSSSVWQGALSGHRSHCVGDPLGE